MPTPLRVLLLEDSPTDAEVMLDYLRAAGYAPVARRVETEADFLTQLEPGLDLILLDYTLPGFTAPAALQLLRAWGWDIPVLVVTGTVSEEVALECLRLGAADYLLKDRLARLGEAVRTALAQRALRHERAAAEAARQASDAQANFLGDVLECSAQPFVISFPDGRLGKFNTAFSSLVGYPEAELRSLNWSQDLTPPDWQAREAAHLAQLQRTGTPVRYEKEYLRKDGARVPVELLVHLFRSPSGTRLHYHAFVTDLTQRKRAEAAARESEERYRSLFDNMLNGIAYCRMLFDQGRPQDFIYLEVNRAFETLTGLQNLVGKKVSEVIPGIREADPGLFEIYGRVALTGVPEKFEVYVRALQQWFAISVYSPTKEHFVAIFDVVTERKQANAALAARTAQLEAVRAVSAEITRELELRTVLGLITQRACELTGATAADLDLWDAERQLLVPEATYGHAAERPTLPRRLGEGAMGTVAETRQGLILNDYRTSSLAHPRTLAQTRITASLLEPLLYGDRLLGVLGVDHEVKGRTFTGRDQATLKLFAAQASIAIENARLYRQIQEHASTLEARVQERTRDLEAARNAAEAASRAKSEFLSNMSHELRTPLNSILGFAQVLQEQTAVTLSAKQVRYLTHIYSSGRRLLQIINDILDFNMIEAGKIELHPEELELPEILDGVLALTRDLATKKGHRVTLQFVEELPRLTADPIRLKQILLNLLSNAVKFTPDGGLITVAARQVQGRQGSGSTGGELFEPAPQGFVEFRVSDTGIGIKAEDLPRLFQEFEQLEPTTTKSHEGTGLGLALTRRLVELHGGRIWAESAGEGQGSTFTVILPLEGPSTLRPE